uniref:Gustatory receptor 28b n=1 Tax=Cacopsylla melanoneura TaxID=428564 RepID=A0A8D9A221_9HEMI
MKLLLRVHNALCRMTYLTTDVFSVQLLLSMACCFGYITSNMYYLSNTLLNKIQDTSEGAGYRKLVFLVFASYWIVVTFLELLFIITACERPVKALQAYSDLLEFQKISLSCCGLFSLDNTLIYSIIGGAATYCVIIIQFGYN